MKKHSYPGDAVTSGLEDIAEITDRSTVNKGSQVRGVSPVYEVFMPGNTPSWVSSVVNSVTLAVSELLLVLPILYMALTTFSACRELIPCPPSSTSAFAGIYRVFLLKKESAWSCLALAKAAVNGDIRDDLFHFSLAAVRCWSLALT